MDSETLQKDRYAPLQDRNTMKMISEALKKTSIAVSEDRNAALQFRRATIPNRRASQVNRITALLYTGATQEDSPTLWQNHFGS